MANFQKIIDVLSGALCILDFSHIISGTATYLIITLSLHLHGIHLEMINNTWTIICSVLLAYISGVFSWALGKVIRKTCFKITDDFEKQFEAAVASFKDKLPSDLLLMNDADLYAFFWIELGKKSKERVDFINRFWVMQAMFEGLIASCLVAFIAVLDLKFSFPEAFCTYYFLGLLLVLPFAAWLFAILAREQARFQIKEVVLGYKSCCCPADSIFIRR